MRCDAPCHFLSYPEKEEVGPKKHVYRVSTPSRPGRKGFHFQLIQLTGHHFGVCGLSGIESGRARDNYQ
jgi:hypothetical protein